MTERPDVSNTLRAHRALLGPAWRYQLAPSLSPRLLKKFGDPWLTECRHYRAAQAAGAKPKRRPTMAYDLIAEAVSLNGNAAQVRALKMMVIADMSTAEIEQRLGVRAAVVNAWEALFFDVRDLRQATSWLNKHVIQAERNRGNDELAARLKIAHCAGPAAVRTVLDADQAIPLDVADELLAEKLQLQVKLQIANAMPIESREQALEFKKYMAEWEVSCRRIQLESRKLDEHCQRARQQYEIQKLRCELAIQRTQQAAARIDQRATDQGLRQAAKQRSHEAARRRALQDEAERKARADRAAVSPLARIRWRANPSRQPEVVAAAPIIVPFCGTTTVAGPLRQTSDCHGGTDNNVGANERAASLVNGQSSPSRARQD